MSDCSTAAMLPKEPPNTCGTCANVYERILKCHYASNGSFTERTTYEDSKSCSQYVERQDTQEQRYGQLEQVARDMLQTIKVLEKGYKQHVNPNPCGPLILPMPSECCRDNLRSLGVQVDD